MTQNMYPQSGRSFLFMIYANCGAITVTASTTYMNIVELFDEYPATFFPEMTMISLITTPTTILNDVILTETPKLAVEGNRFWSRSGHWN